MEEEELRGDDDMEDEDNEVLDDDENIDEMEFD